MHRRAQARGQDGGLPRDPPRRGTQRRLARDGRGGGAGEGRRRARPAEVLADRPEALGEELRLERREWPTDIGPVDLMCRDEHDGWVAVEIKRIAGIEAVEQLGALPGADPRRPGARGVPRGARGAAVPPAGGHARRVARDPLRRGRSRGAARRARARADACSCNESATTLFGTFAGRASLRHLGCVQRVVSLTLAPRNRVRALRRLAARSACAGRASPRELDAHAGRRQSRRHPGDDRADDLRSRLDANGSAADRVHQRPEGPADARVRRSAAARPSTRRTT